ncbi:hypothetical protein ACIRBX_26550 [Kitasatospora sp. NPDC096147]|uniref:hypothetical protein n=1 Tax=Kitasatospora sp. NPDC096147 TaxID=3364093 RepID=UPI003804AE5A
MSAGTEIQDPAALDRAAAGAREIAWRTQTAGARPADETDSAARAFGGGTWDGGLNGALTGAAQTWSAQVSALTADCGTFAEQCDSTATQYQRVEADISQTFRSMANGFG